MIDDDVDQRATARGFQKLEAVAGDAHDAVEVHFADLGPVGVREMTEIAPDVQAGIVDQHVDLAMRRFDGAKQRVDVLATSDVDRHGRWHRNRGP